MNTVLIIISLGLLCIAAAVLLNYLIPIDWDFVPDSKPSALPPALPVVTKSQVQERWDKASMLPPPLPDQPKASVSAAEFLAQIKAERAERKQEPVISAFIPAPEEPKAPKKRSKLFVSLVLCATFAFGIVAGSIGGCVAAGRYQLVDSGRDLYRIDRLTSKIWLVADLEVYPVEEKDRP